MNINFENENHKLFFREGKITYLRPLLKTDIRLDYLSWLNNPQLNEYSAHFRSWPTTERDIENFYNNEQKDNNNVVLAACCKKTGIHFGNYSLNNIDWISRTAAQNTNIGIKEYRSIHYFDSLNIIFFLEQIFISGQAKHFISVCLYCYFDIPQASITCCSYVPSKMIIQSYITFVSSTGYRYIYIPRLK